MHTPYNEEEAHAGESDEERPDWYYRGLGYDEDHPRASESGGAAREEPEVDVGHPEAEDQEEEKEDDASEDISKPLILSDPFRLTVQ